MPRVRCAFSSRRVQMLVLAAIVGAASAVAYARATDRASTWRARDITVDGSDDEWRGEVLPVKGEHFSLGIVNDGEYLYLCLPTKDAGTKTQISNMGIVVWLDREGKKRKFGLHFPVPNPPRANGLPRVPARRGGEAPEGQPSESKPEEVPGQEEIGVLGPGTSDARLVPLEEAGGIEARVGVHDDLLVYELRIPLKQSGEHPYALNVEPGGTVRLEIETAPMRPGMPPVAPGGLGIPGRPWGGGWGISFPRRGPAVIEPIDVTMNVHLAKGPQ